MQRARRASAAYSRPDWRLRCSRSSPSCLGRSLTHRLNVGQHVATPSYAGADYYPFLLAAVKLGVALLLARLAWRFVRAHTAARAGRRVLAAVGQRPAPAPADRASTSRRASGSPPSSRPRLLYLVQTDAEQAAAGRWPLLCAMAAHLRAAGFRGARRPRRPRLERRRILAQRLRALREGHLRPSRSGSGRASPPPPRSQSTDDRLRAAARALRPRVREPAAAPPRLVRGQRPAPAGPCVVPTPGRWI